MCGEAPLSDKPSYKPRCRTAGTSWERKSLPAPRCKREFGRLPSGIALHGEGCKQACSFGSQCIFRDESSVPLPCPQKSNFISIAEGRERTVAGGGTEVVHRGVQWASSLAGK